MNKTAVLKKLDLPDAFAGFVPLNDSKLTGWGGDAPILSRLVAELKPSIIIEVGSWKGQSTATMAESLIKQGLKEQSIIIAVDTWLGSKEHWEVHEGREELELTFGYPTFYKRFLSNMKLRGYDASIIPLPLPSLIAARYLAGKAVKANLIYIDGSHDEKDVYEDLCAYWELLSQGGIIFGDDFQWPTVARAVKKFCAEKNVTFELEDINWSIQKKDIVESLTTMPSVTKDILSTGYKEAELTYLVLDFNKESESRQCLQSIKKHTKFPHKVIYLHNGPDAGYAYGQYKEGLVDEFIQTLDNHGLAIGTRDLFSICASPYAFYLQNDQFLLRDFTLEEFKEVKKIIGSQYKSPLDGSTWTAASVDLAGAVCGLHTYSERGHLVQTDFYKMLEKEIPLGYFGAGPYHQDPWREEQIQKYYQSKKYLHYTYQEKLVEDNGYHAIRQNLDGSLWEQRNDTKEIRLLRGPVKAKGNFPNFTDIEWEQVLKTQNWPEWQIPEKDKSISYHQWH
jgi:predicted O-methyltransferase YrrM